MYVANQSIGFYIMGILGLSKFSKSQARFYYYFFEKKKTLAQVFSYEFCEISKNTFS